MKRLSIYKNNVLTNQLDFSTQELLDSEFEYFKSINAFGVNAHTIQVEISPEISAQFDEYGNEISPAVPAIYENVNVSADYEYIITDITDLIEQERINQESLAFLSNTDWKVMRHRDQIELGIQTSLTEEEFQYLLEQRQIARNSILIP